MKKIKECIKMKLNLISTAIAAALLSVSVTATADDGMFSKQSEMTQMLLNYDANGDGIISRDELLAAKTDEFNNADTDTDGYLSWEEFQALAASKEADRLDTAFTLIDADASGDVTVDEFSAMFTNKSAYETETVFAWVAGDDAVLSAEEFVAMHPENASKGIWRFVGMDDDEDGQLSVDEYTDMPAERPSRPERGEKRGGKRGH
jgi:Ca2+-binding EF-hand superfamily protein